MRSKGLFGSVLFVGASVVGLSWILRKFGKHVPPLS